MKSSKLSTVLGMAMGICSFAVQADVYRCTQPDGKSLYQETPCAAGTEKKIDDSTSRARVLKEKQEQQEKKDLEGHLRRLRNCITEKMCESSTYARLLEQKPISVVLDVLGEPESVQNFDGREIHYFTVPTIDGRKRAKLQITYLFRKVDTVNVY